MPETAAAALHRRSIREYEPRPVEREVLERLLTLAGRAPSAWNLQPWRWVVVSDPETKARLHGAAFHQRQVANAPSVIVLYSDIADSLARVEEALHPAIQGEYREKTLASIRGAFDGMGSAASDGWGRNQANIALGYLLLVAETMGLATSPMLGFNPAAVKELLGLPERAEVAALIAVGYGAEEGMPSYRFGLGSITQWR